MYKRIRQSIIVILLEPESGTPAILRIYRLFAMSIFKSDIRWIYYNKGV